MKYAELLDMLITKSGFTAKDIADKCSEQGIEITPSYISLLRNKEKGRIPSEEISIALAKVLGQNENLLLLEGYLETSPQVLKDMINDLYKKIVMTGLQFCNAEVDPAIIDEIIKQTPMAEIITRLSENTELPDGITQEDIEKKVSPQPINAIVKDNAMKPIIIENDQITVAAQKSYQSGDIVAIYQNNDFTAAVCRKVQIIDNEIWLFSFANDGAEKFDKANMLIFGKVISVNRKI